MGCDIHIVAERRKAKSAEWIGIWTTDTMPGKARPLFAQRDYGLFQRFGVRGRSESGKVIYPRNIPEDVSRLAWTQYMRCPEDHHSASHCTPQEFADAWLAENPNAEGIRADHAVYDLLGIDSYPDGFEYRLVFWFDN